MDKTDLAHSAEKTGGKSPVASSRTPRSGAGTNDPKATTQSNERFGTNPAQGESHI